MKLIEIIPGKLYTRGNLQRVAPATLREEMKAAGVGLVVSLIKPNMLGALSDSVPNYFYEPMADSKHLDVRQVESLADDIYEQVLTGDKVVIHCNQGRNRAGLIAALVVARILKISYAEAMVHVRDKRPRAIANPVFEKYLTEGGIC